MLRTIENSFDVDSTSDLRMKSTRLGTKRIDSHSTPIVQAETSEVQKLSSELIDWNKWREVEQRLLNSIPILDEERKLNFEEWLSNVNHIYDRLCYPKMNKVIQAVSYLEEDERKWYRSECAEIDDDWERFCERLKDYLSVRTHASIRNSNERNIEAKFDDSSRLQKSVEEKFEGFDGVGEGETWLVKTIDLFDQFSVSEDDRMEIIPRLLTGYSQLWFIQNERIIYDFETFIKLFTDKFSRTSDSSLLIDDRNSNCSTELSRKIIRSPMTFSEEEVDVFDRLEKVERWFKRANWDENRKLRFISTHFQDDPCRWWSEIKRPRIRFTGSCFKGGSTSGEVFRVNGRWEKV